jgi:hypothetical protein
MRVNQYWPDICYAPFWVWHLAHNLTPEVPAALIGDNLNKNNSAFATVELLNILGNWRREQGIYQFPQPLMKTVAESGVVGHFSEKTFASLPEFGIYVETPGFSFGNQKLHGFFASQSYAIGLGLTLRLALDKECSMTLISLSLEDVTNIDEALSKPIHQYNRSHNVIVHSLEERYACQSGRGQADPRTLESLVALLIFICQRNDEITDSNGSTRTSSIEIKARKKAPMRVDAPPKTWNVGLRRGADLGAKKTAVHSDVESAASTTRKGKSGTSKVPHVRQGHIHRYRYGKRKDENGNKIPKELRPLIPKWHDKTYINCTSPDALVPTLHRVTPG